MTIGKWFFIFSAALIAFAAASLPLSALAYPLPGTPAPEASAFATTSEAAFSSSSFDFGTRLQGLFSPFTTFVNNLVHENTTINTNGVTTSVTLTPDVKVNLPDVIAQMDDWIYAQTGFRPTAFFNSAEGFIKTTLRL